MGCWLVSSFPVSEIQDDLLSSSRAGVTVKQQAGWQPAETRVHREVNEGLFLLSLGETPGIHPRTKATNISTRVGRGYGPSTVVSVTAHWNTACVVRWYEVVTPVLQHNGPGETQPT